MSKLQLKDVLVCHSDTIIESNVLIYSYNELKFCYYSIQVSPVIF